MVIMKKEILFVRSGGGMTGLDILSGIWLGLEEDGIVSTENSGTSAGGIVSAVDSFGHSAEFFANYLRGLRDEDVRSERPFWKLRIPWLDHFMLTDQIERQLKKVLPSRFESLGKKTHIWATRARDGSLSEMSQVAEDVHTALLASLAISGVFPRVEVNGEEYVDGGVRFNLPLLSTWKDFDEVWLLIGQGRPEEYGKKRGILRNLLLNVQWLMSDQILDVLDMTRGSSKVHVIWPQVHTDVGMLRFDHGLIEQSQIETRSILKRMNRPEKMGKNK